MMAKKVSNSVGINTHPCFTPAVILNSLSNQILYNSFHAFIKLFLKGKLFSCDFLSLPYKFSYKNNFISNSIDFLVIALQIYIEKIFKKKGITL